jgi:hypothetical protein
LFFRGTIDFNILTYVTQHALNNTNKKNQLALLRVSITPTVDEQKGELFLLRWRN